ncbi:MAG: hypothetical protein WBQ37_13310 [Candidatus Competibacter sp.]
MNDYKEPSLSNGVRSPFNIEVIFSPQEGATIKTDTLSIRYGLFDITQRILGSGQAEISPRGIKVRGAEIDQGNYKISISIEDSQGRVGSAELELKIL